MASGEKIFISALLLAAVQAALFLSPVFAISPQAAEYLRKARVFFADSNLRMARDYLQKAIKIDAKAPEVLAFSDELNTKIESQVEELRKRALFFLEARNLPEAHKLFSEVLTLDKDDELSRAKLQEIADTYKKIDDYKSRGVHVSSSSGRSHDLDMYSAVSHINRARGLFAKGDRNAALTLIEEVLQREPGYKPAIELKDKILQINQLEAFIERAEAAFLEGRMRETADALNRLIEEMPDRHEFLLMRAKANLKLKRYNAAVDDLWRYYRHRPEMNTVFPLLSDAHYGLKNYLYAYAFSFNPGTGATYKPFFQRMKYHIYAYLPYYLVLLVSLTLLPFTFYVTWRAAESLFVERFSLGSLGMAISCIFTIIFKSPEHCLGNLIVVARDLNIAWVNYLTGITLFKIGQIEGAQRFLAYSRASEAIRPRALYFFGLTRKLQKNDLCVNDFEEAVLTGLAKYRSGWHPYFVKQIEREVLQSYSKEKSEETIEGMAYKLVEDITGV